MTMLKLKKKALLKFEDFVRNFFGNTWAKNYTKIVQKLLKNNKIWGEVSNEQGEQINQDLKVMGNRWDVNIMADYC